MGTPVGVVSLYAGASAPTGWLICNGAAVSSTTYATLFGIVSTTWGAGDGSTTFNLPDLRGRAPIGVGTGSGLTARALADLVGAETVTLDATMIPSHTHNFLSGGPTVALAKKTGTGLGFVYGDAETLSEEDAAATQGTGGGGSHANMQPSVALNFIIYAGTDPGLGPVMS